MIPRPFQAHQLRPREASITRGLSGQPSSLGGGTMTTGPPIPLTRASTTLPNTHRVMPDRPWDAMTTTVPGVSRGPGR